MKSRTKRTATTQAENDDPRTLGTLSASVRLVAVLESDTARAERSRGWTAEADPSEWPDAVDDWFIGLRA
jgi:hypothetical protein